jgi:hypothetical protein
MFNMVVDEDITWSVNGYNTETRSRNHYCRGKQQVLHISMNVCVCVRARVCNSFAAVA